MRDWLEVKWYVFKKAVRLFFLRFDVHKKLKFRRALHKYADRISIWEQGHDGPPPIVWSPEANDYIWVNRFERGDHQKRIKKAVQKLPFSKPNRRGRR